MYYIQVLVIAHIKLLVLTVKFIGKRGDLNVKHEADIAVLKIAGMLVIYLILQLPGARLNFQKNRNYENEKLEKKLKEKYLKVS